ncbi:MAG: DNA repair protein RecO [Betaproteobacteria bacterium]|nr:DNA repair protein RecO [Betaproteobacteria bacterium]
MPPPYQRVLHHYDWSESSRILEVFTRQHGRVALVAKGAKRPTSSLRAVLLPLQPLLLSYGGDGEIRTLKSAEWAGGHVMPSGDALLSGYYVNELLMRLLARDDPHLLLFDRYRQTIQILASGLDNTTAPLLRAFELLLLKDSGLLPDLSLQTMTLQSLQADKGYGLVAEGGLRAMTDGPCLLGMQWLQLQTAINGQEPVTDLLRICAEWPSEDRAALQTQLRHVLHYHCGVNSLRTRQVMMDVQAL